MGIVSQPTGVRRTGALLIDRARRAPAIGPRELVQHALTRAGVSIIYDTRVGVKSINGWPSGAVLALHGRSKEICSPEQLLIGVDWLKDEYSQLGSSFPEAPHVELMRDLRKNSLSGANAYLRRLEAGTLDSMRGRRATPRLIRRLTANFHEATATVASGRSPEVGVVRVDGKTYLLDGKHRAAVALMYDVDVVAVDVTQVLLDSWFVRVELAMRRNEAQYSRHIRFLAAAWAESAR